MVGRKYFAVRIGREGPAIYDTWDECNKNVSRFPGAIHKSFTSKQQAQDWVMAVNPAYIVPLSTSSNELSSRKVSRNPKYQRGSVTRAKPPTDATAEAQADAQAPTSDTTMPTVATPQIILSSEQKEVLQRVRQGRNVFFTGSAGTGKSVLLREIINLLGGSASSAVGITASTGIASTNIGGTTLHSWAGIGLGQDSAKNIAGKIVGQPQLVMVRDRWRQVKSLIVDEISMIDGKLFDKLEDIARRLRRNEQPFGGIQLVLSGDFCQLPPVPERQGGAQIQPIFAFDAQTWDACVGPPIFLTRVFRQRDQTFVDMLNAMRMGQLNSKIVEEFNKLSRPVVYPDGIEATELFPTRREVDNANSSRLVKLPNPQHSYQSVDYAGLDSKQGRVSHDQMERLLDRLVVPKFISLKIGAQVMLIKNLIQGELVNGSIGQVIDFCTSEDESHAEIGENQDKQKPSAGVPQRVVQEAATQTLWPLVRFLNGRKKLCNPVEFTVNNAQGQTEASRHQIPLILAWALSVHKSQGQTLERVKVDLQRTFEKGQAYVALSRATSMQSLQVLGFHPDKVMAHPRVLEWHNKSNDMGMYFEDEMDNEEATTAYYEDT